MEAVRGRVLAVRRDLIDPSKFSKLTEQELAYDNPAYDGNDPLCREPSTLYAWSLSKDGRVIYLPRCLPLNDWTTRPIEIEDRLNDGKAINITTNITPEEYQVKPIARMTHFNNGILLAPCGAGKTVMGIKVIADKGRKALVLVMTEFLMGQWIDEICKFSPDATVGIIGGGSAFLASHRSNPRVVFARDADIVVATIQTLVRDVPEWLVEDTGTILSDEAHHAAARTFLTVLRTFKPRHLQGVTATWKRADGLHRIYKHFLGAVAAEVTPEELRQHGRTVNPKIQQVYTNLAQFLPEGVAGNFAAMISYLIRMPERNDIILDFVEQAEKKGRYTLVLSERVEHCLKLATEHRRRGGDCCAVVGSVPKKLSQLAGIVEPIETAFVHRTVFATLALVSEGLNQKQLNTLILATPFSNEARFIQAVGRAVRALEGKTGALVFDLVDSAKVFLNMARKREDTAKAQGWNVKHIDYKRE